MNFQQFEKATDLLADLHATLEDLAIIAEAEEEDDDGELLKLVTSARSTRDALSNHIVAIFGRETTT